MVFKIVFRLFPVQADCCQFKPISINVHHKRTAKVTFEHFETVFYKYREKPPSNPNTKYKSKFSSQDKSTHADGRGGAPGLAPS